MIDQPALSRRHFLWQSGGGLGAIALAWMLDREARAGEAAPANPAPGDRRAAVDRRADALIASGFISSALVTL